MSLCFQPPPPLSLNIMAANTQGETTADRIERDERNARIAAAEVALGVLGDTLVCSPSEGLDQEIGEWLTSLDTRREEVRVHLGRASFAGVPTDWCDDFARRMTTFEGRENAAQSVEGLAIETQYRTDRVQRDEAEARQAREAEDEACRAHDAGGEPSRSEEGRRDHEETEGESSTLQSPTCPPGLRVDSMESWWSLGGVRLSNNKYFEVHLDSTWTPPGVWVDSTWTDSIFHAQRFFQVL
ncbi:hypothetical protein BD410DRAFT_844032 [Rickenella mellea]|uniref:Uncharacterized protein n=1 Tax=Rickenella mellea TaxID=50990 RepID=A0A4Y7PP34_9AGAM|nr:hypothetical protein BD410DRAFT_844032 [Rickenella mellea]